MMKKARFSRDFILVVIGQIISLFGNAALRFAIPLYLLNQTGSSVLYGTVTACAFLPSIVMSPIGGIVADRVNKRTIMVVLDFFTAALTIFVSIFLEQDGQIFLLAGALMLLYGIAGAYQPSVQSAIPVLVTQQHVMKANSVINTVNSLSSLTGPVLGGVLYSTYGLRTVLIICLACFFASAVMEIFIHIPYKKPEKKEGIWKIVRADFEQSFQFIRRERPEIGKVVLVICGINLFLSAMIIVGMPYIITEVLEIQTNLANRLCGFAEGALGAGGLAGGICAGIFSEKLQIEDAGKAILICALCLFPMGISMLLPVSALTVYGVLAVCCFIVMLFSTIFTVQMISYIQIATPRNLIGKVIAMTLTVSTCSQPLGNALYGILFDACRDKEAFVILFAGITSLLLAAGTGKYFGSLRSQPR